MFTRSLALRNGGSNSFVKYARPIKIFRLLSTTLPSARLTRQGIEFDNAPPKDYTPVVSYHDGERVTSEIQRHTPVASNHGHGHDLTRPAQPLKPGVIEQLTPTMRKFTLSGKIAVVTGCVVFVPVKPCEI